MSIRARSGSACVMALAAVSWIVAGCGGQATSTGGDAADASAVETTAALDAETEAALVAILSQADLLDGAEDHVVSKCPGCGLRMDGSADHALEIADYELHFCSLECKGKFEGKTAEMVLALEIPADLPAALPE